MVYLTNSGSEAERNNTQSSGFDETDLQNLVAYLEKSSNSSSIVLDKIKALTNIILKKGAFNYIHNFPIRDQSNKTIKTGSVMVSGYTFTSVHTRLTDKEIKSVYGRLSISNETIDVRLPGIVKAFLLTFERTEVSTQKNFEARISMAKGKDSVIKYAVA